MGKKVRVQILLEPEQHETLAEIAHQENSGISDVVREIVRDWLRQRELQALEELTRPRLIIQEQHGVYSGELLEEARTERDEDMARVLWGEE